MVLADSAVGFSGGVLDSWLRGSSDRPAPGETERRGSRSGQPAGSGCQREPTGGSPSERKMGIPDIFFHLGLMIDG